MKQQRKGLLVGVLAFSLFLSGCSLGGCGRDVAKPIAGPSIAVVNLKEAVKKNPAYDQYKKLEAEYNNLEAQYRAEQQSLTMKAQAQAIALKGLGDQKALTDSYNLAIQSKILAKEQAMNLALAQKRNELVSKYKDTIPSPPTAADLRIVSLQLELQSDTHDVALGLGAKRDEAIKAERAKKEAELQQLLAERNHTNADRQKALEAKVMSELQPIIEAGRQELAAYAEQVKKEAVADRDKNLQEQAQTIMAKNGLPNPVVWNSQWAKRLENKKAELQAMHDAILEDIRARVAVIAQKEKIDLVLVDDNNNVSAKDLTNEVMASYEP